MAYDFTRTDLLDKALGGRKLLLAAILDVLQSAGIVLGAPVGGAITWTKSSVTMTGASAPLLAANALRKGVIVCSTAGNAAAAFDPTGGTSALDAGVPVGGGEMKWIIGAACPVGAMTQIGTNTQKLTVYEGV